MDKNLKHTEGGFTLPGEAGYEQLTLDLAKKWGADVIRDSDGTVLSDEITNSGYGISSTICIGPPSVSYGYHTRRAGKKQGGGRISCGKKEILPSCFRENVFFSTKKKIFLFKPS